MLKAEPQAGEGRSSGKEHHMLVAKTVFPIVCVGGSARALDAYIHLLKHIPATTGVAIVIVNHLRQLRYFSIKYSPIQ